MPGEALRCPPEKREDRKKTEAFSGYNNGAGADKASSVKCHPPSRGSCPA